MDENQQNATAAELNRLNNLQRIAVFSALGLLILSFVFPSTAIAIGRSLAWTAAGVLSLMATSKAKQLGAQASYLNAILYFAVAVLPLLRGR